MVMGAVHHPLLWRNNERAVPLQLGGPRRRQPHIVSAAADANAFPVQHVHGLPARPPPKMTMGLWLCCRLHPGWMRIWWMQLRQPSPWGIPCPWIWWTTGPPASSRAWYPTPHPHPRAIPPARQAGRWGKISVPMPPSAEQWQRNSCNE